MRTITRIVAVLLFLYAVISAGPTAAQARFEVVTRDSIAEVSGLRVVTIRDNQLAACYTVFILEPSAPGETVPATATPEAAAEQESVRRIREAAETYDRQIAELNAQFEARVGRPPRETWNNLIGWPYTFTAVVQYELDRSHIANQYAQALQDEVPSTAPFATAAPGMKTGNWQDLAEAVRRAVANPATATGRTFDSPGGLSTLIESGFQRMIQAPRLAASGPTPCDSGSANR